MVWIELIVAVVILAKVINKGGDWFDFLDGEARYENWWSNFEFNAICLAVWSAIFIGAAWYLFHFLRA
jgi:hypothetical protein